ncbi:MAG: signal peptidase I [Chloroflexi bacterium RBG_16_56_11]|nr:MAG: signal peptidase I [Chloroflexi bacterium RBG_16_56_11]
MEKYALVANRVSDFVSQDTLDEMWREAFRRGNSLAFRIISGSMRPTIEVGDVVRVSRADSSRIRHGDIAVFRDGRNIVVHRVISKRRSKGRWVFRHMGDACRTSGRFAGPDLIGKVTAIEKEGREVRLDSTWHTLRAKMSFGRLKWLDTFSRRKRRHIQVRLIRLVRRLRSPGRPRR